MPTNKPEVVLPELPAHMGTIRIYAAGGGDELATVAAYTADQMRAYGQACIDTLTRPAGGEFHECQHCKGWSRTTPPAIDIGKLRDAVNLLDVAIASANKFRVSIHLTRARRLRNELAALIGDGGERKS